jgi:Protein of unknown function (DUF3830)
MTEKPWIEIEVSGATARLELLDRIAPKTSAALLESLPISSQLTHARWAGSACWAKVDKGPIAAITELESQATSLYRGTLGVRPGVGRAELFLSYGQAESRHERGRTYMTPVARVMGDAQALFEAMAATWKRGSVPIEIRRAGGASE